MSLIFKGDSIPSDVSYKVNPFVSRTFPETDLHIVLTFRKVFMNQRESIQMANSVQHLVNQFNCSRGDIYISKNFTLDVRLCPQMFAQIDVTKHNARLSWSWRHVISCKTLDYNEAFSWFHLIFSTFVAQYWAEDFCFQWSNTIKITQSSVHKTLHIDSVFATEMQLRTYYYHIILRLIYVHSWK